MFTFCPLQGALSGSPASQSLLELDGGVKVLVDVGWDETFDVEKLRELEKQIPTLSLILLTHATVSHLGAYAHCCKHVPLFTRIPVYATRPVIELGRSLCQELYSSNPRAATVLSTKSLSDSSFAQSPSLSDRNILLQAPTPEEIVRFFSLIQPLKYSQPHQPQPSPFSPPLNGLTITAYNSGHSLGGTIWHIQHGLESIVYAVDWNHARENVFAGAAWLGGSHATGTTSGGGGSTEVIEPLRKPTALVCSSRTPEASLALARRDEQLLESLRLCVARGGTVLIPCDSAARVLELAYLLERAWRDDDLRGAHGRALRATRLFLAGRNVRSTVRLVRSMLEWMNESVVREFETLADGARRTNGAVDGAKDKEAGPFDFRYLRLLEKKSQVERVLSQAGAEGGTKGTVILASDTSLEWGFSRDILRMIASDPRNLVILPERPSTDVGQPSLSQQLWEIWKERPNGVATEQTSGGDTFEQVYGGGRVLDMGDATRQPLGGDDGQVYQQWLATQRQLQSTGGAGAMESAADGVDDVSSESSSESDDSETEQQGKVLNVSATMGQANRKKVVLNDEDLGVTILIKRRGVYDFDVRGKKGRERMFPLAIRRRRNDEFGELIRPDDFLRAEEREEGEGNEATADAKTDGDAGLGRKRKWDDVGAASKNSAANQAKRPGLNRLASADDLPLALTSEDAGADELDAMADDAPEPDGPCRLVVTKAETAINLRIAFVDFSGLHDKRNLNMLIPLIQPRKLILVAGTAEETRALAADCRELLSVKLGTADKSAIEVLTPAIGIAVDASVDTNAWIVRLTDPLVKGLRWQNVRGLAVAAVSGVLLSQAQAAVAAAAAAEQQQQALESAADEGTPKKRLKTEGGDPHDATDGNMATAATAEKTVPTLDIVPANTGVGTTTSSGALRAPSSGAGALAAPSFHVGDLRLTDLRRAMQGAGHTAEFRGEGTLLVDGAVAVRKSATGRVELESVGLPGGGDADGAPVAVQTLQQQQNGGTFYAVRRLIYEGLAVVAGA